MVELYNQFCKDYPVISIEDPFDQDDSASSTKFTAEGVCQVRRRNGTIHPEGSKPCESIEYITWGPARSLPLKHLNILNMIRICLGIVPSSIASIQ